MFTCAYIYDTPFLYTCAWYARHLALSYVLAGCIWQPWILMSRSWSPDLSGLAVADQSAQRILSWWSERSRNLDITVALSPSSSHDWLSGPLLLLVSISQFLLCISLHVLYFCIFWWCNILVILYHSLCDNHVLVLFYWNVYYRCASALWFWPVLILSVYTWGYLRPAYIRRSDVSVPTGSGRHNWES